MSYTIELVLYNILLLANIAIQYIFIWENPFKSIGRFALNINGFMEMGPLWLAEYMQNFPNALQAQFTGDQCVSTACTGFMLCCVVQKTYHVCISWVIV